MNDQRRRHGLEERFTIEVSSDATAPPPVRFVAVKGCPNSTRLYTAKSMLNKRKIRELAMQILFLWDSQEAEDKALADQIVMDGSDDPDVRRAAIEAAIGTWEQRKQIDERLERIAPQWPPRRQPGVDRNLIRLSVWEMTSTDTPPKVVIDEAIEMAREFSTEQSASFVNGVLDAVLKENSALMGK